MEPRDGGVHSVIIICTDDADPWTNWRERDGMPPKRVTPSESVEGQEGAWYNVAPEQTWRSSLAGISNGSQLIIEDLGNRRLSLAPPDHIILDSIGTWPTSIQDLLTSEEEGLRSYLQEEQRLDHLAECDVILRIRRPANPHRFVWDRTVERVRQLACAHAVVGFHCARLVQTEVDDIRANGLRPPSPCFALQRVDRLVQQGSISQAGAQAIRERNEASADNREGRICFFHCLSTLRDESGLYRLFRWWGGEALYCHHEADSPARDDLRRSGMPCIVLAAFQSSDICTFGSFEEHMTNVWLDRDGPDARPHDCETHVQGRGVRVLDVIVRADPRFEELTDCLNWRQSID